MRIITVKVRLRAVPILSVTSKLPGLERVNSSERGKHKCEVSESQGEAGEKAQKEGGTAFSFVTDAFKFLRGPSIGELDWLINNRMLSARCHCNL